MERKVSIKYSGVGSSSVGRTDGKMKVYYSYIFSDPDKQVEGKTSYGDLIAENSFDRSVILNYENDAIYNTPSTYGIYNIQKMGGDYSVYRREYANFKRGKDENYTYIGDWEPVAINIREAVFRDFNVASGHSYQYIVYSTGDAQKQSYANGDNDNGTAHRYGAPVSVNWDFWTLIELEPFDIGVDAPIVKKGYKADIDNMWFLKYNLDVGAQNQEISKNEIITLGRFPKFSSSSQNNISGKVTCLLGSEVVPYSADGGYVERLWRAYNHPLSTNDRVTMLDKWREIVYSSNPKLLRDSKGQSWIIQIISASNTPYNTYKNEPDTISFEWKQIEDPQHIVIYGAADDIIKNRCNSLWKRQ